VQLPEARASTIERLRKGFSIGPGDVKSPGCGGPGSASVDGHGSSSV